MHARTIILLSSFFLACHPFQDTGDHPFAGDDADSALGEDTTVDAAIDTGGEDTQAPDTGNAPPSVIITTRPPVVPPATQVPLEAEVNDPEGDDFSISWAVLERRDARLEPIDTRITTLTTPLDVGALLTVEVTVCELVNPLGGEPRCDTDTLETVVEPEGTDFYVSAAAPESGDCTLDAPCPSLGKAVDLGKQVADGSQAVVIHIAVGAYPTGEINLRGAPGQWFFLGGLSPDTWKPVETDTTRIAGFIVTDLKETVVGLENAKTFQDIFLFSDGTSSDAVRIYWDVVVFYDSEIVIPAGSIGGRGISCFSGVLGMARSIIRTGDAQAPNLITGVDASNCALSIDGLTVLIEAQQDTALLNGVVSVNDAGLAEPPEARIAGLDVTVRDADGAVGATTATAHGAIFVRQRVILDDPAISAGGRPVSKGIDVNGGELILIGGSVEAQPRGKNTSGQVAWAISLNNATSAFEGTTITSGAVEGLADMSPQSVAVRVVDGVAPDADTPAAFFDTCNLISGNVSGGLAQRSVALNAESSSVVVTGGLLQSGDTSAEPVDPSDPAIDMSIALSASAGQLVVSGATLQSGRSQTSMGALLETPESAILYGNLINVDVASRSASCTASGSCLGVVVEGNAGGHQASSPRPTPSLGNSCCDPNVYPVLLLANVIVGGVAPQAVGVAVGGIGNTERALPTCLDGNRILAGDCSQGGSDIGCVGLVGISQQLAAYNNVVGGGAGSRAVGLVTDAGLYANNDIFPASSGDGGFAYGVLAELNETLDLELYNNILFGASAAVVEEGKAIDGLAYNHFDSASSALMISGGNPRDLKAINEDIRFWIGESPRNQEGEACTQRDQTTGEVTLLENSRCVDAGIDFNTTEPCAVCKTPIISSSEKARSEGNACDLEGYEGDGKPDIGPFEL